MVSSLDELRRSIENLRKETADGRSYVDPKSLKALCTQTVVSAAIKECNFPPHNRTEIEEEIFANGIVTFSILVYIGQGGLTVKFLEHDMDDKLDDRLPRTKDELEEIAPGEMKRFSEVQWEFTPVILKSGTYKQIGDKFILPFTTNTRHGDRDGSFGDIYEITVESPMQKLLKTKVSRPNILSCWTSTSMAVLARHRYMGQYRLL